MSEQQAKDFITQAQKKLNSWSLFGPSNKFEDAAELYEKAGNNFKLAQQWDNAGDAFIEAAKLFKKGNSAKFEGSRAYDNAAKCYKRYNPEAAIKALREAVILDQEGDNFRMAAKHNQEIAELYEEANNRIEALETYEAAAKLFDADDSPALTNKCRLKVADIAAELEDYDKASKLYEELAKKSVDDPLLKWSVKEYLFKAVLCHLCTGDIVKTKQVLAGFCDLDMTFDSTREYKLLEKVTESIEQDDIDSYTQAVYDYDKLTKLDPWKTTVLLKIKKTMESEDLR